MCTVCIYLYKLNVYTYIHIHNTYFLKETPEAFGKVLSIYCMWRTLKRRHTHINKMGFSPLLQQSLRAN